MINFLMLAQVLFRLENDSAFVTFIGYIEGKSKIINWDNIIILIPIIAGFCTWIFAPLFRNKRFMLDEMFQQNASKFAILYYWNTETHGCFSFFLLLYFFSNVCLGLCQHRQGHSLGEKIKSHEMINKAKKLHEFSYS